MKLQRTVSFITGAFFAVGFAASQAGAGTGPPGCDFEIEVNALRGRAPTVTVGGGARSVAERCDRRPQPRSLLHLLDIGRWAGFASGAPGSSPP